MHTLTAIVKLLLALLVLALGMLACACAGLLTPAAFSKLAVRWNALAAACLGVRVRVFGAPPAEGALLLANHISWLDPLVFGAQWPVIFLANSETARWPVLGWIIRTSGALFIERGRGAQRAVLEIGAALRARRRVVIFPEGRTGDGRTVARFQPRLLQAAVDTGAPLQPVALRYRDAAGARVTRHSFAGVTFLRSLWACMRGPGIIAEIRVFAPLPHTERREMARRAEELVRAAVE
ncbi:MAG: 1-acyl-sn-glycerol-3-phosphate acyltransferase [Gammaproteobacteria bacterium]